MDPAVLRDDMVDGLEHVRKRPLPDPVSAAMRTVPRHLFVSESPYANREGERDGSRVLAPATVARLLEALSVDAGHNVLVVGTGVGYTAAVVAEIAGARNVQTVDIDRRMVYAARQNLRDAGYGAVLVDCQDGAHGLSQYAPFDRVLVEAAAVEPPRALVDQLAPDGRLVMPRGNTKQMLVAVEPGESTEYTVVEEFGPAALRPMLVEGEQGAGRGPARNRTVREDAEFAQQGYFAPTGWEYDWVNWDEHL